ncbi:alpha-2,8-sialyltransferase 8F-like isoform X2 [Trichomycterus rosablanca]|uniref:alpha-2,8-sialyltransferase 8F-like isoform X2 n=1 Tax=Trichomycterus rosablanca TaxID=2290929 RepID=UPI002F353177
MRAVLPRLLTILFLASFCSVLFWVFLSNRGNNNVSRLLRLYSSKWRKHESNFKKFRLLLSNTSNAFSKAIVTQSNTPVGSKLVFDGDPKKSLEVKQPLFNTFVKKQPFKSGKLESCTVVGNGGILANSSCGKEIDAAEFVIRCNLAPLGKVHEKDVGNKTHLVTANPSIFQEKYKGLMERRRPFVESLHPYGNSLLLLPAFSFAPNTPISLRVYYTLEDFRKATPQVIFLNPDYVKRLAGLWKSRGLCAARLSTGLIMASLAVELCDNVHLYGFWPFEFHPTTRQKLSNHYYDNRPCKKNVHSMSTEFELLLELHTRGVLHLHLGECPVNSD